MDRCGRDYFACGGRESSACGLDRCKGGCHLADVSDDISLLRRLMVSTILHAGWSCCRVVVEDVATGKSVKLAESVLENGDVSVVKIASVKKYY